MISSAGREPSALPGGQPVVQLQPAQLLEHVDHGVLITAQAEWAAGVVQGSGGTDAVGQIPFGGGAEADAGPGVPEQCDVGRVRCVACTAVVVGASNPWRWSSSAGVQP